MDEATTSAAKTKKSKKHKKTVDDDRILKRVKSEDIPSDVSDLENIVKDDSISKSTLENWSTDDLNTLITNIEKQIGNRNHTVKYSTTIKGLNWDSIAFGDHTSEDCKVVWNEVMERLRKFRNLQEILEDAKVWAKKPWTSFVKKTRHPDLPKRPLTPFFRYFMEKREALKGEMSVTETAKYLSEKYKALKEKKKKKYQTAYEKEMEEYKVKLEQFKKEHPNIPINFQSSASKINTGPLKPKSPIDFFKEKLAAKLDGISKKELLEKTKEMWKSLSPKKKIKYIDKSLEDEKRYKKEVEAWKKSNPEFKDPYTKSVISKELKELKERADGRPDKPPSSGYALYSRIMLQEIKDCPSKEKMSQIAKRWKELTEDDKAYYNHNASVETFKYVKKLDDYVQSLPEDKRQEVLNEAKVKLPSNNKVKQFELVSTLHAQNSSENEEEDD